MSERRLLRQQQHTYASWYTCECTEETDTEKKNCWIKPLFLFSFVHKKILLSHWWHTMSVLPFWALNVVVALLSMEGQKAIEFHQKYLNLCSKGKRKSYGLVINDRIVIFGWTIPLNVDFRKRSWTQFSDVRATLYWTDICIATCIALWVINTFGNVGVFLGMNPVLSLPFQLILAKYYQSGIFKQNQQT